MPYSKLLLSILGAAAFACSSSDGEEAVATGPLATFEASGEGFELVGGENAANLLLYNGGHPPTLSWDASVGSETPGSLLVTAAYQDVGRFVDVQHTSPKSPWSGGALKARVRIDSAASLASSVLVARLYANSYSSAEFGYAHASCDVRLEPGSDWQLLACSLATAAPAPFDTQRVLNYGVMLRLESGVSPSSSAPLTVSAHIDDFELSE